MKIEKEAEQLVTNIYKFMAWLDNEMTKPSSVNRGGRVAKATNKLEMIVDAFAHFSLKFGFKKISNIKNKARKQLETGDL